MPRLSVRGQRTLPGVAGDVTLLVGQDLVDGGAVEVAVGEGGGLGAGGVGVEEGQGDVLAS